MIRELLQSAFCVCLSPLLVAQEVASSGSAAGQTTSNSVTIPRETEIGFVTLEPVSSATATKHQPVRLAVEKDVAIKGVIAIPKGTLAVGEVSRLTRGVPGKRDGSIRVIPAALVLAGGTQLKLKENRWGEDDCGDMGPCWALFIFTAPLLPLILISKAGDANGDSEDRPKGEDQTLSTGYPVEGFTTSRIALRSIDQRAPKPAPANAADFLRTPTPISASAPPLL